MSHTLLALAELVRERDPTPDGSRLDARVRARIGEQLNRDGKERRVSFASFGGEERNFVSAQGRTIWSRPRKTSSDAF